MNKPVVFLLSFCVVIGAFGGAAEAQDACFPECRAGFVCSPAGECVSICNPPCGEGQLCTAETSCVADPSALPVEPQATPPSQELPPLQAPVQAPAQRWEPAPRQWEDAPAEQPSWVDHEDSTPNIAAPGSFRLSLGFHLGAAGSVTAFRNGNEVDSTSLDPTFGVQLPALAPVGSYVLLGGSLGYRSILDALARDRTSVIALNAAFGVHYAVELGSVSIDPFALVTLGLGVLVVPSADAFYGLDLGVRLGCNVWFPSVVGLYASVGYQRGDYFKSADVGGGFTNRLRVTTQQAAIELGLALRF
jgi:hypothetical protein